MKDRAPSTRNKRRPHVVLVVDDTPAQRYAVVRMLQTAGYRTTEVGTGTEALTHAKAASAVVLDVHLPDIDGLEVCRRLRACMDTQALPIVHLSAVRVADEDSLAGTEAGADAYFIEPVDAATLTSTLDRLLFGRGRT